MTSSDKDFRFMATNDLMAELQKDSIKLDDDSERKVSRVHFDGSSNCLDLKKMSVPISYIPCSMRIYLY